MSAGSHTQIIHILPGSRPVAHGTSDERPCRSDPWVEVSFSNLSSTATVAMKTNPEIFHRRPTHIARSLPGVAEPSDRC